MKSIWMSLIIMGLVAACSSSPMPLPPMTAPPPPPEKPAVDYTTTREHSYRMRAPVPTEQNRYEGSLWRDESSWGNLLRDHRARFKNDVLTITDLTDIIIIPKKEKKPAPVTEQALAGTGAEAAAARANQILDVAAAVTGEDKVEEEQNEVLASLKTISARVTQVLPNGNMVVIGEKIDYRQQNTIRYVTKIKGIIRPEDVSDKNEIGSLKLARSEVQIKRQVQARKLNLGALAPLVGQQKAGFLDRLSHIATPTPDNRQQAVGTQ
ncbi:MAG: flagellar basal body L-ring protein FlgH [bacterium]|nr:flagellar basal body L-ring protein FlgH [bacterium]